MRNLAPELSISEILLCIITSALVLSPLGSNYLLVIGGSFFPEIGIAGVYVLHIILLRKKRNISSYRAFIFYSILAIILCLIGDFLSFLLNDVSIIEIYAISGAIIFLFLGYSIFMSCRDASLRNLGSLLFVLSISSLFFAFIYNVAIVEQAPKRSYSIFAMATASMFIAFRGSLMQKVVWIVALFAMAVHSSFRAYIVYAAILAAMIILKSALDIFQYKSGSWVFSVKQLSQLSVFLLVFLVGTPLFISAAYEWIMQDQSRYHQIIYKFQEQYGEYRDGNVDGDLDPRIAMNQFLVKNYEDYILPNEFFSRNVYSLHSAWGGESISFEASSPTRDGGFIFLTASFGLLVSIPLTFIMVVKIFLSRMKNDFKDLFARALISIVLFGYYFTSGAMFLIIDFAFYFGFLLAVVSSARPLSCFNSIRRASFG